jgi:hypothetical protein
VECHQRIRRCQARRKMLLGARQHTRERINHDVADAVNPGGVNPFAKQVLIAVGGGRKEPVGKLIGEHAVDLFRHAAVARAQAGFDVAPRVHPAWSRLELRRPLSSRRHRRARDTPCDRAKQVQRRASLRQFAARGYANQLPGCSRVRAFRVAERRRPRRQRRSAARYEQASVRFRNVGPARAAREPLS